MSEDGHLRLIEVECLPVRNNDYMNCGEIVACPYNAIRLRVREATLGFRSVCGVCRAYLRLKWGRWEREERDLIAILEAAEEQKGEGQRLANPIWDELSKKQEEIRGRDFLEKNLPPKQETAADEPQKPTLAAQDETLCIYMPTEEKLKWICCREGHGGCRVLWFMLGEAHKSRTLAFLDKRGQLA